MIYGYARVSTDGQSVTAQVAALTEAGAEKVFREVASGAQTDRAQLRRAVAQLAEGDMLLVTRLDRLARSTRDLLNVLDAITKQGASFRSIGDEWANTTTPQGRVMLTVLSALAEWERELIRSRTGEGRDRAKARGAKFGRKPKLTAFQKSEAIRRRDTDEPLREIARSYNVSHSTISETATLKPYHLIIVAAAGLVASSCYAQQSENLQAMSDEDLAEYLMVKQCAADLYVICDDRNKIKQSFMTKEVRKNVTSINAMLAAQLYKEEIQRAEDEEGLDPSEARHGHMAKECGLLSCSWVYKNK